ncbi:DNA repair protein RecN [Thalassocella blandensis]|nr:DNA repair protein RecN [Thalassocella blandensis]
MLIHLQINDFTLVDHLDIELEQGLTTITGETGAGKSIMLDALGLALGDRGDPDKIRTGCDKTEIQASFDISELPHVQLWLQKHDLNPEDEELQSECILRRIVTKEGRSRSYINGRTVPLQQLRSLGDLLIDIHNQHEHQSLLKLSTHRRLLDEFAGQQELAHKVKTAHTQWSAEKEKLDALRNLGDELNARFQLLSYQVGELEQLDLKPDELELLESEQRMLSNADAIHSNCQQLIAVCDTDEEGLKDRIQQAMRVLGNIDEMPPQLNEVSNLLQSALINIEEAQRDVERYLDGSEQDPARLGEIEERLSAIYDIARKHRTTPENLVTLHNELAEELSQLQSGDEQIEQLEKALEQSFSAYQQLALQLSEKRTKSAKTLSNKVNKHLSELAMAHANLTVDLCSLDAPSKHGNEKVEFLISTAPGQPAKALNKVASGGELSRVSLAIQVVTAATSKIPTLVFDEVDVGVGGTTGDVVGRMLRELGEKGQVFCVTHLAQVASKAHHHFQVEKTVSKKHGASSSLLILEGEDKIMEIARMMGGAIDSVQSIAHAKEMLENL